MRVLLVHDTEKPLAGLRPALAEAGYEVREAAAADGALLRAVEAEQPDALLVEVDSPSPDLLAQLSRLHDLAPRPVVVFSSDGDEARIRAAVDAGVTAYVVDGLSPARLAPVLRVALARFARESGTRRRLQEAQQALQDRKLVECAKGLLMDRRGLSEAQAYATLRQLAMQQGIKLAEAARRIQAMGELLG